MHSCKQMMDLELLSDNENETKIVKMYNCISHLSKEKLFVHRSTNKIPLKEAFRQSGMRGSTKDVVRLIQHREKNL